MRGVSPQPPLGRARFDITGPAICHSGTEAGRQGGLGGPPKGDTPWPSIWHGTCPARTRAATPYFLANNHPPRPKFKANSAPLGHYFSNFTGIFDLMIGGAKTELQLFYKDMDLDGRQEHRLRERTLREQRLGLRARLIKNGKLDTSPESYTWHKLLQNCITLETTLAMRQRKLWPEAVKKEPSLHRIWGALQAVPEIKAALAKKENAALLIKLLEPAEAPRVRRGPKNKRRNGDAKKS
jgi:hypothetical protein